MIDALGGIEMCLPKAIKDKDSHLNLKKGCQTLSGTDALGYVRMRKADPLGDLGRVQRQRQMLAAIAKEAASPLTVINPVRYWNLTTATADAVAIGEDTSFVEMARMASAMRKVSSGQGITLTVPVSNSGRLHPGRIGGPLGRRAGGGDVRRHRPWRHQRSEEVREVIGSTRDDSVRSPATSSLFMKPEKHLLHSSLLRTPGTLSSRS